MTFVESLKSQTNFKSNGRKLLVTVPIPTKLIFYVDSANKGGMQQLEMF